MHAKKSQTNKMDIIHVSKKTKPIFSETKGQVQVQTPVNPRQVQIKATWILQP